MAIAGNRPEAPPKERALYEELGLTDHDLLEMYHLMALSRAVSDRMWVLNRMGKAPFTIGCNGQEAAQVGSAYALRPGFDWVAPYYRDVGVALTVGMTPLDLLLATFAREADPSSRGRQMPNHFGHARLHILTGSSPVATQIPQAAGLALASKLRGEDAVTIAYFGDGATSKGDFHEGLNFAGVHRLPVIFFCENNRYAISVPQRKQMAIEDVSLRAAGYGFPGVTVDGQDILAVYGATKEAVDRARRGEGPTLIEAKTYRLQPHSSDDDDRRYRSQEEVEAWRQRDPIIIFQRYLTEARVLAEEADAKIRQQIAKDVDDATRAAEASPLPKAEDALRHVYAE
ncbi:MAG TPA: thiamine pyrophosphate-dependent dehydrogenase E1 component subunit alpha [Dehalococcoidia bacterium]|nr:thiamine pyrophosphate-dependent dehydrogenase E1 component subunit alpha [Dehalococcoidia bacterium]